MTSPKKLLYRSAAVPGGRTAAALSLTPRALGWERIHFAVRHLAAGAAWAGPASRDERCLVLLSGEFDVSWNGTSQAEFAHLSPPGEAAAVAAVQTSLAFSGAVFGPPLFALIASMLSYRMAFFAVAACVLAAAVWQLLAARTRVPHSSG